MTVEGRERAGLPWLSVIVPTLNEGSHIAALLQSLRTQLPGAELIVADGGSSDTTLSAVAGLADQVIAAPRGRAAQMNAGASLAGADYLLFLHADCRFPPECVWRPDRLGDWAWGFFPVRLTGSHPLLRVVEVLMNIRSRVTSVATGDQGLFIAKALFERSGGFAALPLMEDVEFCKRLRCLQQPLYFAVRLRVSSRRWEQRGILRTVLLMWWLRLAYVLGVSPERLHRWYYSR